MEKEKNSNEKIILIELNLFEIIIMEKKEQEIWDFAYKEVCLNLKISKVEFAMSNLYDGFKRRFNYFIKKLKRKHEDN